MTLYYPGYTQARDAVQQMTEAEMLAYLDDLQGRDNLPENYTPDDLRVEALNQCREEFTDRTSPEYELNQFWIKVIKADIRRNWWQQ